MELSLFLAKFLGLYMLIIAAVSLLRKHDFHSALGDFLASKALLFYSGFVSILLGLLIVLSHPIFEWDFRGLITLLGFLIHLRGIARIAFPTYIKKSIPSVFKERYWLVFAVLVVVGLYLTYHGFFALNYQVVNY